MREHDSCQMPEPLVFAAIAFTLAGLPTVTIEAGVLDGLISHWPFNEGTGSMVYDVGGVNNNDGTIYNMEPADWVSGMFGNALDFNGVDNVDEEYVNFGNDTSFNVTNAMTVSMWFNKDGNTGISEVALSKVTGGAVSSWQTVVAAKPTLLMTTNPAGNVIAQGSSALGLNSWHHLAMTYGTADGTGRLYVDGQQVATASQLPRRPVAREGPCQGHNHQRDRRGQI